MKSQKLDLKRSPLHYNGNKFSIADQIIPIINKRFTTIVEPFAGTGIISLNSSIRNVHLNDSNKELIQLLKFFKNIKKQDIGKMINTTEEYNLTSDVNKFSHLRKNNGTKGYSEINREGYKKLKKYYVESNQRDISLLFLLTNYSFNRMLRFNSRGEFNVPVGKGDFSSRQIKYLEEFSNLLKKKNVTFSNADYKKINLTNYSASSTLFYIDPPYLNGTAQYNANWSVEDEFNLYDYLDHLHNLGFTFLLSNTIFSNGKSNLILKKWIEESKYKVIKIKKIYSKTSYNKKNRYDANEIIVTNMEGNYGF